ncbi:hypothetical protein HDV01_002391 [Terramyces sp. JEL0728]|nr:hypothetical protein HDV01_002391 [Terramyces sp. JEL0728]
MSAIEHPFYPRNIELPHFVPQQYSALEILVPFFAGVGALIVFGTLAINTRTINLTSSRLGTNLVFLWFLSCGVIHTLVEGYYAFNQRDIAGQTAFLADLWKEYAKSDSRYMTSDSFVWIMESVTAMFWGTLSFYNAYLIYTNKPSRHLFQFTVSLGQFYGDVLYYFTTLVEGAQHCTPHPYYFYFYFVFMNILWIFFPAMIMYSSGKEI